ncbi:MAG: hypothetical protein CMO01_31070 [Thalassobius sp.]|nr:hypothetical protein [Thalassovita sp.]
MNQFDVSNNEVILKEKNFELSYNPSENILYCNWIGFQSTEKVKDGCNKMLEVLKSKKCSKVLNDNTHVTGPWQYATEWVATEWFPEMEKSGLEHFAWVFSQNVFAQLSAKKAIPASGVVTTFKSTNEGINWLRTLN